MTSSNVMVVGLSHHTAPLEVRERLAIATEQLAGELSGLIQSPGVSEALLVSTCNRVELYAATDNPALGLKTAREYLKQRGGSDSLDALLYERVGEEAARHTFRVAASLDSMVVGEPQILGQMKSAFSAAESAGSLGMLLGRCFHRAFAVAKRVRTETGIASGAVSVSSIAIELTRKIFGDMRRRRTLLVGAGKMGEVAARNLAKLGAVLVVINRSPEKAIQLAKACGGKPEGYERLASELAEADVVITSTSSPRFVITPELMKEVVRARKRRPIFLIDIAVPRDVDPRVGNLDNVFLYDVDDLQKVAAENLALRRREANAAEQIVELELAQFEDWRRTLDLTPTIVALRSRFRQVVHAELERTLPRLSSLSEKERKSLEIMADAMVKKLLHQPLTQLKQGKDGPNSAALIATTRRLFDLGTVEAPEAPARVGEEATSEPPNPQLAAATGRGGQNS